MPRTSTVIAGPLETNLSRDDSVQSLIDMGWSPADARDWFGGGGGTTTRPASTNVNLPRVDYGLTGNAMWRGLDAYRRSGPYYAAPGSRASYEHFGLPGPMYQRDPYATAGFQMFQTPWGMSAAPLLGFPSRYPHVLSGVPLNPWGILGSFVGPWMTPPPNRAAPRGTAAGGGGGGGTPAKKTQDPPPNKPATQEPPASTTPEQKPAQQPYVGPYFGVDGGFLSSTGGSAASDVMSPVANSPRSTMESSNLPFRYNRGAEVAAQTVDDWLDYYLQTGRRAGSTQEVEDFMRGRGLLRGNYDDYTQQLASAARAANNPVQVTPAGAASAAAPAQRGADFNYYAELMRAQRGY